MMKLENPAETAQMAMSSEHSQPIVEHYMASTKSKEYSR